MKTRFLKILILLLILILASPGCDRQVVIHGKVYEWINPPAGAHSQIFHKSYTSQGLLTENLPAEAGLQPVKDAHVQCFGTYKTSSFYSNEITGEKGDFKLVIPLGQITRDYPATIQVVKNGYQSVKREIVDRGSNHTVNVILVKE